MPSYLIKTPGLVKLWYYRCTWEGPAKGKAIYFSFDDGPHPRSTPFILSELKRRGALATFFCLGKNVLAHPDLFARILEEGHQVGNHTQHHLNGWKTPADAYLEDIRQAAELIVSPLFRPPYGKISSAQIRQLTQKVMPSLPSRIIMWDVLSGDFDLNISGEKCLKNTISATRAGSIIVFHDSEKAWERMSYALPRSLDYFAGKGFSFRALPTG